MKLEPYLHFRKQYISVSMADISKISCILTILKSKTVMLQRFIVWKFCQY